MHRFPVYFSRFYSWLIRILCRWRVAVCILLLLELLDFFKFAQVSFHSLNQRIHLLQRTPIRQIGDTDSLPVEGGGLHFIVAGFRITGISVAGKDEGGR